VLGGGEDYELVFTAPAAVDVAAGFERAGLEPPIEVGACVADPQTRTLGGEALPAAGWQHRFDPGPEGPDRQLRSERPW